MKKSVLFQCLSSLAVVCLSILLSSVSAEEEQGQHQPQLLRQRRKVIEVHALLSSNDAEKDHKGISMYDDILLQQNHRPKRKRNLSLNTAADVVPSSGSGSTISSSARTGLVESDLMFERYLGDLMAYGSMSLSMSMP